jgi:hypothetical protein
MNNPPSEPRKRMILVDTSYIIIVIIISVLPNTAIVLCVRFQMISREVEHRKRHVPCCKAVPQKIGDGRTREVFPTVHYHY